MLSNRILPETTAKSKLRMLSAIILVPTALP